MPSSHDSTSPVTRPPLHHSSSSTPSANARTPHSPSTTPPTQKTHKAHRPHVVGGHRRNPSYGKNLNKIHRLTSAQDVTAETKHARKKSGSTTPSTSPRSNLKRNSSNLSLNQNGSHVSLNKNHSNTSLKRNTSSTEVKKSGLHQSTLPPVSKGKRFEIGDSGEEEDWTDQNSSQSPNTTRDNSRTATRPASQDQLRQPDDDHPPESILRNQRARQDHPDADAITSRLLHWPRGAKAPPKMSTVSATGIPSINHNSSFTYVSHGENHDSVTSTLVNTPSPAMRTGISSSAEGGVSRFINGNSDDIPGSASPIPTTFPLRTRTPPTPSSRRRSPARKEPPSRTQQKLWLQRAATESVSSPNPISVSPSVDPLAMTRGGSSHGSRRGIGNEVKIHKKLYERATSELGVVRRFRNPVIEGLTRIDLIDEQADGRKKVSARDPLGPKTSDRKMGLSQSLKDRERERAGRVRFQNSEGDMARSRDDIGIGTELSDDEDDGGAESLLRRMWGSREIGVATND